MEREKIIQMFKNENLSKKAGCGCKKKKFAEDIMENPCTEGYVAYGTKIKDGREVPNCIPEEMVKEGFPIPSPESDEDVDAFISRCMGNIGKEYPEDQALAICYDKWENK